MKNSEMSSHIFKILQMMKPGSVLYEYILNVLFVVYALLLPFSNAFVLHTGPYLLLLFWILEGRFSSKIEKIKSDKAIGFLLLFLLINALSLLWTDNIKIGLHELKYYFAITVVFLTFYTSLKKSFILPVLVSFLLSMFVSEIYYFGFLLDFWKMQGAHIGKVIPYMNRIMYSIFLVIAIFLSLKMSMKKQNFIGVRIFSAIVLLSTIVNLFLNGGRTGQVALIFGVFIFTLVYFERKMKFLFMALIILSTLFLFAYNFSPMFKSRVSAAVTDIHNIENNNMKGSIGIRLAAKIVAVNLVNDNLLTGVGIGDAYDAFHQYAGKNDMKKYSYTKNLAHTHDQYLHILLQTGIIGLLLFVLFIFFVFRREYDDRLIKAILFAILTVFLFTFFTNIPLKNYITGLFGFSIAFLLRQNSLDLEEKNEITD